MAKGKQKFVIDDYMPDIEKKRRPRSEKYPFGKLEIGKSFFVCTHGKPGLARTLESTVCAANLRYSVIAPDGSTRVNNRGQVVPARVQLRKFIIVQAEEDGKVGVRICRVEL